MHSQIAKPEIPRHNPDRYRGKNLLFLLLATGVPAGFLYLRLVFGYVALTDHRTLAPSTSFIWAANLSLLLFFIAQLISAWYLQRLLKRPVTLAGYFLQYVAVLIGCLLVSVTAAVLLEAFGYEFVLRMRTSKY